MVRDRFPELQAKAAHKQNGPEGEVVLPLFETDDTEEKELYDFLEVLGPIYIKLKVTIFYLIAYHSNIKLRLRQNLRGLITLSDSKV